MEDALRNLTCGSGSQGGDMEVVPAPSQSLATSLSEEKPPPPPPSGQTFLFQGQPIGEAHAEARRGPREEWSLGRSRVWAG